MLLHVLTRITYSGLDYWQLIFYKNYLQESTGSNLEKEIIQELCKAQILSKHDKMLFISYNLYFMEQLIIRQD